VRICLLTTQDLDAVPFPADDWPCDPRPFLPEATWHVATLKKATSVEHVTRLVEEGFDLFFNLCDGAADQDIPGIEVVQTLEKLGVPFTGATSEFYEPPREVMKQACYSQGIDTPAFVLARATQDVERAAETLRFPLFVKHYSSYSSVSLSRASRVQTPAGLRRQARKMMSRHGAALIEEYVDGIECTVLVAENPDDPENPTTYTPMQYRFPPGEHFKHSKMKWVDYSKMISFPVTDPVLEARLRDVSARFFVALKGASFGRCDLRVDADGTPFMLEINANCGVYYPPADAGSADLCLAHDPAGHLGFTRQLVEAALRRHARNRENSATPTSSVV
jgi:D-alanine-D-alanine ligase